MIAYFPTPYPDELLYSQLARYYTKSGYTAYAFAAEDLYLNKNVRPDMEFVNTFTEDAFRMVTRDSSMEEVILKRTMFPYYGRFLPKERRLKAFQSLVSMQGNYYDLLPMPNKRGVERCLRYCPLCSAKDRQDYGETYWHRTHQMIGIKVCPVHKCYLMDSNVPIRGEAPPMLRVAEEVIPLLGASTQSENELECRVAEYMTEVFQAEVDLESDVMVGHFLQSKLADTQYHTLQGKKQTFYSDFFEYYKDLSDNQSIKPMRLDKSNTVDFYEVCLMAVYLKIPVSELVSMKLPERTQPQLFKGNSKPESWQNIDNAALPFVKDAIIQLWGNGVVRPKKVTVSKIERLLRFPDKYITRHLPQCYSMIKLYEETHQQFWAREVVWAAQQIQVGGVPLKWRTIYELTNICSANFKACLPYLDDYADEDLAKQLRELI